MLYSKKDIMKNKNIPQNQTQKRKESLMKILVFDIGGTAIKYGICQDGHLEKTKECPTEAF